MGETLIWDKSSRAWRDGAADLENRLRLGNDNLVGCPKGQGRGKWSCLMAAQTGWGQISLDSLWCGLSEENQEMWDGHSLEEVRGENRYFCGSRRPGNWYPEGAQKSLCDLHESQEGGQGWTKSFIVWRQENVCPENFVWGNFGVTLTWFTAQWDLSWKLGPVRGLALKSGHQKRVRERFWHHL